MCSERVCGAKAEHPKLDKMWDQLRDGDVVVVTQHHRLYRCLRDLLDIVEGIEKRGQGSGRWPRTSKQRRL